MKVIYESKDDSVKKLAEGIAEAMQGIDCIDLQNGAYVESIADGELVFLGSGGSFMGCGKSTKEFIKKLAASGKKVRIVLFGSSFIKNSAVNAMRKTAEKQGLKPMGDSYNCKGRFLFLNAGHPNSKDINSAKNLAIRLTKN